MQSKGRGEEEDAEREKINNNKVGGEHRSLGVTVLVTCLSSYFRGSALSGKGFCEHLFAVPLSSHQSKARPYLVARYCI